jgi:hypothetical protein
MQVGMYDEMLWSKQAADEIFEEDENPKKPKEKQPNKSPKEEQLNKQNKTKQSNNESTVLWFFLFFGS